MNETLIAVLLGGVLAIMGSVITHWYESKKSLKNRMNEIVAERKVDANAQAYSYMKVIQSTLGQGDIHWSFKFMLEKETWFVENRLFLPEKFPANWFSIRNSLAELVDKFEDNIIPSHPRIALIQNLVNSAINEIYSDMSLSEIVLEK